MTFRNKIQILYHGKIKKTLLVFPANREKEKEKEKEKERERKKERARLHTHTERERERGQAYIERGHACRDR